MASWRTPLPTYSAAESSEGHSTVLSSQLLQDGEEHGKTSELNEHGLVATLLLL